MEHNHSQGQRPPDSEDDSQHARAFHRSIPAALQNRVQPPNPTDEDDSPGHVQVVRPTTTVALQNDEQPPDPTHEDGQVPCPSTTIAQRNQDPATYYHSCGAQGQKVRRCGGCSVACYCSKECQKKAWPIHKGWCRPSNLQDAESNEEYGDTPQEYRLQSLTESPFTTRIAAINSFQKFKAHHHVASKVMIDAAAYLLADGGHFEDLQAGAPHVAVFHMVPRHGDPDLGRSWALRSFDIRPIDYWTKQYPGIKPSMPSTLAGHKAVAEAYRNEFGSRYSATLITAYHILDNVYDFGHRLVLTPSDPGLLTEQPVPDALRDLINLCFFAINHDIVLPTPSLEDKIFITSASEPIVNHRTKTRKFRRVQRTLDTVYGRLIKAGYPPKSTLSTTQMMNLLERMYPPI